MLDWYEIVDDGRVQDFMSQFMVLLQILLVRLDFEPLLEILLYVDYDMYHPWVISCVGKPERNYVPGFWFWSTGEASWLLEQTSIADQLQSSQNTAAKMCVVIIWVLFSCIGRM